MNHEIMNALFPAETAAVDAGICPFCLKHINVEDFTDKLSYQDYKITGMCQACQDEFYAQGED